MQATRMQLPLPREAELRPVLQQLVEGVLAEGPLEAGAVAHVGLQVAEALQHAHERHDLVHRDVTPRNVMVDDGGHAREGINPSPTQKKTPLAFRRGGVYPRPSVRPVTSLTGSSIDIPDRSVLVY